MSFPTDRGDEIDIIAGNLYLGRGLSGYVGFSIQPWAGSIPKWRVVEVIARLRAAVRSPNTVFGDIVIVMIGEARMFDPGNDLGELLSEAGQNRWFANFGERATQPLRFESEFTLPQYFEYQIWRRKRDQELRSQKM